MHGEYFLPQEDQGHVVHDMKSPFNGLVGLTEAMASITKDPARKAQFLLVNKASKRCCDRIEQQVSCDKLASSTVDFSATDVDLSALVSEAVAVLSLSRDVLGKPFKAEAVTLGVTSAPETAVIKASEWHVFKIVYELIFNSIKFTEAGAIKISIQELSDSFVLSVKDTGPGFPSAVLEALGKPFNRKILNLRSEINGEALGVGIAFCREVLRFQGGDLEILSSDQGSTVKAVFPKNFRVQEVHASGGPEGFGYLNSGNPETSKPVAQRRALGLVAHTLLPVHFGLLGVGVQLLAGETKPGPKKQVAVLETCAKRVIEVMTLIRDACLLEESEISGSEDVDVVAVIERCVQELHVALDKKGSPMKKTAVTFIFNKPEGAPTDFRIYHDPIRLYRVLYQVMDNANKFTKEGSVQVSLVLHDGNVQVQVKDTGAGFDGDAADMFMPFHRLNGDQFYGLGLGLTMVKAFCDKTGTSAAFSSPGKNKGSTLLLTLPHLERKAGEVPQRRNERPALTVMPELEQFATNVQKPVQLEIPAAKPVLDVANVEATPVAPPPVTVVAIPEQAVPEIASGPEISGNLPERLRRDRHFGLFYDGLDVVSASLYERCLEMRDELAQIYDERRKSQETLLHIEFIDDKYIM